MTDDAIFRPQFSVESSPSGDQTRGARRQRTEAERNQRALTRLREIESGASRTPGLGKKGQVFRRVLDRIAAAQEVGALMREAKDRGITTERVKNEFQRAGTGTRRLDRYMLAPDIDAVAALQKAQKQLQQRVAGYLAQPRQLRV
jgi:hypothetical protein